MLRRLRQRLPLLAIGTVAIDETSVAVVVECQGCLVGRVRTGCIAVPIGKARRARDVAIWVGGGRGRCLGLTFAVQRILGEARNRIKLASGRGLRLEIATIIEIACHHGYGHGLSCVRRLLALIAGFDLAIGGAAVTTDGITVVAGTAWHDGTIRLRGHDDSVTALRFTCPGRRIAVRLGVAGPRAAVARRHVAVLTALTALHNLVATFCLVATGCIASPTWIPLAI